MNTLKNIIITSLGILTIGCGNDFLDISPVNNLGEFDAIQSEQDLDYALNGAYTKLEYYRGTSMWDADLMGDDMMSPPGITYMDHAYQFLNTKNSAPTGRWYGLYSSSFHINTVLEKAKEIEPETYRYKQIVAELRFIRVILHWDAELRYGPAPALLGKGKIKADALGAMITDKIPDNLRKTFYRDKVTDVFKFMISEMEAIVNDLPKEKRNAYLNYWAGKTFMARLYLYNQDWGKALVCAEDVIENGPYKLYERKDYTSIWGQEYTSESIFEMPTTDSDNYSWDSQSNCATVDGYGVVRATNDFLDLMKVDTNDIRFKLLKYDSKKAQYFPSHKFPGRNGNLKVCNPKILRLSECYLIAAEAALNSGASDAGKYLSDLREKRSLKDPRKYDSGITIDDILYERRLELYCEGHRAWDLWRNERSVVRWRTVEEKEAKGHWCAINEIPFDDYRTIWPIDITQLDLMSPEDQISQQNPGY